METNDILKKGMIADKEVLFVRPYEAQPFRNSDNFADHKHTGLDSQQVVFKDLFRTPADGGAQTATFVIGPSSNTDSDSYDYVTDGADDNVQIQAAIDALPANGGLIFFREGSYTLGATVTIAHNGVELRGVGAGTIITCKANLNDRFFNLGHASTQYSDCYFVDIYFDGDKTNQTGTVDRPLIDNSNLTKPIQNVLLVRCKMVNAYAQCIMHTATGDGSNGVMVIDDCFFKDWAGNSAAAAKACAVYFDGPRGVGSLITNSHMANSSTTAGYVWGNSRNNGARMSDCTLFYVDNYTGIMVKNIAKARGNIVRENDSVSGNLGANAVVFDTLNSVVDNDISSSATSDVTSVVALNCLIVGLNTFSTGSIPIKYTGSQLGTVFGNDYGLYSSYVTIATTDVSHNLNV